MGSWGPWPGQVALESSWKFAPHQEAGKGVEAQRHCRKVTDSAAIPRALQSWWKPRSCPERAPLLLPSPSPLPVSGRVGKYLILSLHKLGPGIQALNGVHGILQGHLPPVLTLRHAIPLLPPAARDQYSQGQRYRQGGPTLGVGLSLCHTQGLFLQGLGDGEQGVWGFASGTLSCTLYATGPVTQTAETARHGLLGWARAECVLSSTHTRWLCAHHPQLALHLLQSPPRSPGTAKSPLLCQEAFICSSSLPPSSRAAALPWPRWDMGSPTWV